MKSKIELDTYSKVILTLIAIGLFFNLIKGIFHPISANAVTANDVNIVSINGVRLPQLDSGYLPVEIRTRK